MAAVASYTVSTASAHFVVVFFIFCFTGRIFTNVRWHQKTTDVQATHASLYRPDALSKSQQLQQHPITTTAAATTTATCLLALYPQSLDESVPENIHSFAESLSSWVLFSTFN